MSPTRLAILFFFVVSFREVAQIADLKPVMEHFHKEAEKAEICAKEPDSNSMYCLIQCCCVNDQNLHPDRHHLEVFVYLLLILIRVFCFVGWKAIKPETREALGKPFRAMSEEMERDLENTLFTASLPPGLVPQDSERKGKEPHAASKELPEFLRAFEQSTLSTDFVEESYAGSSLQKLVFDAKDNRVPSSRLFIGSFQLN